MHTYKSALLFFLCFALLPVLHGQELETEEKENTEKITSLSTLDVQGLGENENNAPITWGEIPQEDLDMKTYEADPEADMVILCDYADVEIYSSGGVRFKMTQTRHVRIKILTEEGAEEADVSIPYHAERSVFDIEAQTINGKDVSELQDDDIFDVEMEDGGFSVKKFAFPNVKIGSVLEYKYTFNETYIANPDTWYFQREGVPVRWSEYRFTRPDYISYTRLHDANFDIEEVEEGEVDFLTKTVPSKTFRFVRKNMPAIREEPFMSNIEDVAEKVQFQLARINTPRVRRNIPVDIEYLSTWSDLQDRWQYDIQGGQQYLKRSYYKSLGKGTKTAIKGLSDKKEKMNAVFDFIKNSYTWDGRFRIFANQEGLNQAYTRKSGNSAEINLSLVAGLRMAGLEAYPVLLSTRANGKSQSVHPVVHQFNHIIVLARIGEKSYLLDAIDKELVPNMIHPESVNGKGLLLNEKKDDPTWVTVVPKRSSETIEIELDLGEDEAVAELTGTFKTYRAARKRKAFKEYGEDEYLDMRMQGAYDFDIEKSEFENLNKPGKRFIEKITFDTGDAVEMAGNNIYINPLLTEQMNERVFKLEDRKYPIDIAHPYTEKYTLNFDIPEAYELDTKPENLKLELPDDGGTYEYSIDIQGSRIQLSCEESLNKTSYKTEQYTKMKTFFDQIFDKEAEQIILRKVD